jgi:hypothetical protein
MIARGTPLHTWWWLGLWQIANTSSSFHWLGHQHRSNFRLPLLIYFNTITRINTWDCPQQSSHAPGNDNASVRSAIVANDSSGTRWYHEERKIKEKHPTTMTLSSLSWRPKYMLTRSPERHLRRKSPNLRPSRSLSATPDASNANVYTLLSGGEANPSPQLWPAPGNFHERLFRTIIDEHR